jgi:type I secretion system LssB family ATPase
MIIDELTLANTIKVINAAAQHLSLKVNIDHLSAGMPSKNLEALHIEAIAHKAGLHCSLQSVKPAEMQLPAIALNESGKLIFIFQDSQQNIMLIDDNLKKQSLSIAQWNQLTLKQSWLVIHDQVLDQRSISLHHKIPSWIRPILNEVRPFYRSLLIGSLAVNLLAVVIPLFTMNVYDRVVPNAAIDTLWVLAVGAFIAVVFDWLLKQARTKLADAAGRQIDVKVSSNLFSKIMGMRLENRPLSAGAYAKHVQEFDSVREFITSATLVSAIDLPFTLLFLLLIFWLGGPMVFIPLLAITVIIVSGLILQRSLSESVEESSKYASQRQAYLVEFLNQIIELKQANSEGKAQGLWEQTIAQLADWQNKSRETANTLSHTVMSMQQFTTIGLIITGVYQIQAANISMGALIAIVMISGRAGNAINQLSSLILKYKQTLTAIESVKEILALPQEAQPNALASQITISGKVTVTNLSFNYPDSQLAVLKDISLSVKAGEKIGLYGKAGSGKSSLLALIAGQYQATQGQIFYDDIEARQWSVSTIRHASAWVGQSPSLFYGTVIDNITESQKNIKPAELAQVLEQSGVNQFIDRLELGLESSVGEFGRNLSGGQRQAVAIARALLRKPKLLFLDEPTSAMDEYSQKHLINTLKHIQNTSMFIASHQPSLLKLCDKIVVLDKGCVVNIVPPNQLFSPQHSRLRSIKMTTKRDNN